jgi:hypothetical protein
MIRYRIRDWDRCFETAQSRKVDKLQWFGMPNKQHGLGLTWILAQSDGAAIYGIWCLILGACSHQAAPRQGWLTQDGTPGGVPWTAEDLAMRWRRHIDEIERAMSILSSPKVGWLLEIEETLGARSQHAPSALPVVAQCLVQSSPVESRRGVQNDPPLDDETGEEQSRENAGDARSQDLEAQRRANRQQLARVLARQRFASEGQALEEWIGLCFDAGCGASLEAATEFLGFCKVQGRRDGITSRFAGDYEGSLMRWRAYQRTARQLPAPAELLEHGHEQGDEAEQEQPEPPAAAGPGSA